MTTITYERYTERYMIYEVEVIVRLRGWFSTFRLIPENIYTKKITFIAFCSIFRQIEKILREAYNQSIDESVCETGPTAALQEIDTAGYRLGT